MKKGIIVTFEVKEKGPVKSSLGANVGTQSGDMVPEVYSETLYQDVLK